MERPKYSPTKGEVIEPTDARQANRKTMNFRVLLISTALIVAIFAGFVIVFFNKTSKPMDASSGPQPSTSEPATGSQTAPRP
ncbi:MAG: hypothetical protein J0H37_01540 [Hyphomicrobium denitrificans]|uniref:hypothetical protein n=1 Tax=Hyphomicrobium sp. GJ21 TaxID=113574 RepID=UPI000622BFE1|nr:hypothetical protein [Hyphomicrobium sp. GJ21]MBN9280952.1 hypothetical protein [Hyphomicrobium denitrificans]CEJ87611.1 conserved hypothetical protein [Hyphomicrobium sp. GJ21]